MQKIDRKNRRPALIILAVTFLALLAANYLDASVLVLSAIFIVGLSIALAAVYLKR